MCKPFYIFITFKRLACFQDKRTRKTITISDSLHCLGTMNDKFLYVVQLYCIKKDGRLLSCIWYDYPVRCFINIYYNMACHFNTVYKRLVFKCRADERIVINMISVSDMRKIYKLCTFTSMKSKRVDMTYSLHINFFIFILEEYIKQFHIHCISISNKVFPRFKLTTM